MGNLFEIVIAVTLASILSHISLLLLLGRHEEVYRGLDMLTSSFDHPQHAMPYPMFDDALDSRQCDRAIPQAMPASHSGWGAPIDWQNPGSLDVRQQNERHDRQRRQNAQGHCFTNNYYM